MHFPKKTSTNNHYSHKTRTNNHNSKIDKQSSTPRNSQLWPFAMQGIFQERDKSQFRNSLLGESSNKNSFLAEESGSIYLSTPASTQSLRWTSRPSRWRKGGEQPVLFLPVDRYIISNLPTSSDKTIYLSTGARKMPSKVGSPSSEYQDGWRQP